jgi:hypothetical protein
MPHYNIKFEIYGKKMQTTIQADSMIEAERKLRSKIIIHETKQVRDNSDDFVTDFFNMLKK